MRETLTNSGVTKNLKIYYITIENFLGLDCNEKIADKEDNEHFLLHCPQFDLMRQDLFEQLSVIPGLNVNPHDEDTSKDLHGMFSNTAANHIFTIKIHL